MFIFHCLYTIMQTKYHILSLLLFLGTIFDATGSYAVSFVIAGSFITFSGVICLPLRRIARWENSKSADYDLNAAMYKTVDLDDLPVPPADDDEDESKEVKFMEDQNKTQDSSEKLSVV